MQFVAIDVETANADIASICQVGIARFMDGEVVEEWSTLVDPEDHFDEINVSVHGIRAHMVRGKPPFPKVADRIRSALSSTVSVCHTHFDRTSVTRALAKYNLDPLSTTWLDSARVVRRTWQDLAWNGYGLANVCKRIGYEFQHHDALEDAKAAGFVLLAAMRESGSDLDALLHRVNRPIELGSASVARDGNPEGDLHGEVVVFTGALDMLRRDAADLAASVGCQVDQGVTKKTTILVVGDQDTWRLAGYEKSIKHRKAEQLTAAGQRIRIIREVDFQALVNSAAHS